MSKPLLPCHRMAWLPCRLGSLNAAVMVMQLAALCLGFDWSGAYTTHRVATLVFYGLCCVVTITVLLQLLACLVAKRRWTRLLSATVVLQLFSLCVAHRVRMHSEIDLRAVGANFDLTREVLGVGLDTLDRRVLALGLVLLVTLVAIECSGTAIMFPQPGARWRNIVLCAGAYTGILAMPVPLGDEATRVLHTVYQRRQPRGQPHVELALNEYPLVHAVKSQTVAPSQQPDVFLLLVESFRAGHVEKTSPAGKAYTPYFNQLIQRGLYVEQFYGNSIQTRKGQFAALCSVIPSISGAEFEQFGANNYNCLPRILRRQGYETIFFQAYRKLSFDNTGEFMQRQGFSSVETVQKYTRPEDKPFTWAWGLQDDKFYQRFFEFLDGQNAETAQRPKFVTLAPIGNHMRFNKVPEDRQYIHPHATTIYERFANSVFLADLGLREFFDQLERRPRFRDAVVIITGDHGYPLGEHGLEMNTSAAYDEFFRVPLLVIGPGVEKGQRLRDIPYSQLDIAPTILDMVGVSEPRSHFMGVSLMTQPRRVHPIHLIQPYSGGYVSVVEYPYKYTYHLESGKYQVFDLLHDPTESQDLAMRLDVHDNVARMHGLLEPAFLVQAALEHNRIWPPEVTLGIAKR